MLASSLAVPVSSARAGGLGAEAGRVLAVPLVQLGTAIPKTNAERRRGRIVLLTFWSYELWAFKDGSKVNEQDVACLLFMPPSLFRRLGYIDLRLLARHVLSRSS